jgi:predicted signal transduction protein with EAL and GGDEF domain
VSRQGGDEFVVLLAEIEHAEDAARSAEKMVLALAAPHNVAGKELHITGSIGISIYPDDGQDAETLIKCADTAMYHAKNKGRNNYQFFTDDMNVRAVERQFLEANLRRALEQREFVLHYQPKIDIETEAITGVEALIRWRHPERGLIPPALFVPVAEDCGLIVPIGRWVLHEACRQAQAWIDAGLPPLPIAVNISATEFQGKDFLDGVRATLAQTRLNPRYLELELTESVLMQDAGTTAASLIALKALGVRLAIDDFGTGYSSLSYLRQFPIDTLKIDQSFVREITAGSRDDTIVGAIISMGKSLKQKVIAEGVETVEQLAFLRRKHCGEGQGYHFSRPVSADDFATLLRTRKEFVAQLHAS